jgi:hypothetical protein
MEDLLNQIVLFSASASDTIKNSAQGACGSNCGPASLGNIFAGIANMLIFLVGAISVIAIILGGLRYVASQGDSKQTTQAKDTILYAVIGIVVAIIAFAIVNFVTTNVK